MDGARRAARRAASHHRGARPLTDDMRHLLYPYNYLQFHRIHLAAFPDLRHVHTLLGELQASAAWEGPGLLAIMEDTGIALQTEGQTP